MKRNRHVLFPELIRHNSKQNTDTGKVQEEFTLKLLSQNQKELAIVRERGEDMTNIIPYDIFPNSPLFDGVSPTNPMKHSLMVELERSLTSDEYVFHCKGEPNVTVVVDFMSPGRMII